ncbi:MAG: hypothetical protein D4S01_05460 [Dehalococcoidia bacterium]|nr:MAG: hypothetical protein D4S01_05460 [Dehalococcoidia bacterium]
MSDFSPEIDSKLKAQGICPIDLRKALILVRNLRIQIIKDSIGPKAARIAILFAELADRHFAQQKLTGAELTELHLIAKDLFRISKGEH